MWSTCARDDISILQSALVKRENDLSLSRMQTLCHKIRQTASQLPVSEEESLPSELCYRIEYDVLTADIHRSDWTLSGRSWLSCWCT